LPKDDELSIFSHLRMFDDIRWDFWFFFALNIGYENFNKDLSNINENRFFFFL